jgi:hypothetical protein
MPSNLSEWDWSEARGDAAHLAVEQCIGGNFSQIARHFRPRILETG